MNSRKIIGKLTSPLVLLLLAALLAGGVAWVAYAYLQQREAVIKNELTAKSRQKETPRVSVVVPKADAAIHTVLNNNSFVSRSVDEDLVYPDAIRASDFPSIEGQKLARPVLRGRPVRLSDLQVPEINDVAAVVPAGRRAMTIDIDNLNSIAQTLRPNHHVDIFLVSKAPKSEGHQGEADDRLREQASLFMQNMVVLATGKEFADVSGNGERLSSMVRPGEVAGAGDRERNFNSITLLVSPQEAARLLVGQKLGSFRLMLRGQKDQDPLQLATTLGADVLPREAHKGSAQSVDMIVGGRGANMVTKLPGSFVASASPAASMPGFAALPSQDSVALRNPSAGLKKPE